jgi:hypothetical protein
MRAWLSVYVNQINQYHNSTDMQLKALYAECRTVLKEEKRNIRFLIKRQQIAAYLILYAPWLHRLIYKIYASRR